MKPMTSRERLLAAARRQPIDTIPVSPRLGHVMDLHYGNRSNAAALRLKEIYDYDPHLDVPGNNMVLRNPYEVYRFSPGVEIDIHVSDEGRYRLVDRTIHTPAGDMHEVIKVPNPGASEYGSHPNPQRLEYPVKESEDLDKLQYCIPPVDPSYAAEYRNWNHLAGDEAIVRCRLFGALDNQAGLALPLEEIMVHYMTNRDFPDRLLRMFRDQIHEQTKTLLEEGVRVFSLSYYWCSLSAGWSPSIYRDWFFPILKSHVELIHEYDGVVFYYDDGEFMEILPYIVDAGVDVVETCTPPPMSTFDLKKAKVLYGDKITFMGYIDLINVLLRGTVEDVRNQVYEACTIGGRGGGFILGTSDSFRDGTPKENIDAYFRYGREYGVSKMRKVT